MMVSFSKVEPMNPIAQWPFPADVRSPEKSMIQSDALRRMADIETNPDRKASILAAAQVTFIFVPSMIRSYFFLPRTV